MEDKKFTNISELFEYIDVENVHLVTSAISKALHEFAHAKQKFPGEFDGLRYRSFTVFADPSSPREINIESVKLPVDAHYSFVPVKDVNESNIKFFGPYSNRKCIGLMGGNELYVGPWPVYEPRLLSVLCVVPSGSTVSVTD